MAPARRSYRAETGSGWTSPGKFELTLKPNRSEVSASERIPRICSGNRNDNVSAEMGVRRTPRRDRVRLNEADLEIGSDTIPDSAIEGLIESWIVPMIVERAIQNILGSAAISSSLRSDGFDTYNYLGSNDCSGEEPEGRAPTKAGTAEADKTSSADVDAGRVSGPDRACGATKLDGQ
jgi:hypothetical protein